MEIMGWYYEAGMVEKSDSLALHWYQLAAENGNGDACEILSDAYEKGTIGLVKDKFQALKWLKKGVELNSSKAISNYGYALYKGTLMDRDTTTALEMYHRAAKMGAYMAMKNLSSHYHLKGDLTTALNWLERCAIHNTDPLNPIPVSTSIGREITYLREKIQREKWW